jgi:branched-chain amino acid transport system permease protein
LVPSYLISAEVYASLFALMSMGLTLTYMTTKVPNFAYGDFVVIGIYSSYVTVKVFHSNPYLGSVLGFAIGGLVSVVMYLGVLRPLARRGSSIVSLMIATFAFDIGMSGVFGIFTEYLQYVLRLSDAKQFYPLGPDFSIAGVPGIVVAAPLAVVAIVSAIYLLFTRTKFGVAMRASIENPQLAKVLGINVEVVYVVSWILAGGLAGFAGDFLTLQIPLLGVDTGNELIVAIFAASVLGGLMSIFGSAVGGLIIGGSEILVTIGLGLGFGLAGAVSIAVLIALIGVYMIRKKNVWIKVGGVVLAAVGVWIVADIAAGFPVDFLAAELVNGFGPNIEPYQPAVPLIIMAATLLLIPQGLFSVNFRQIVRRRKK